MGKKVVRPARQGKALTRLRHGYSVAVSERAAADVVSLQAPDGRMLLRLVLTEAGPLVEIESQALSVKARGPLRFDCQRLEINAEEDVAIRAGGALRAEAHAHHLEARLGDITLAANDDVCLDGERVRLNSPKPARKVLPALLPRVRRR
jgi:hypothetical protein